MPYLPSLYESIQKDEDRFAEYFTYIILPLIYVFIIIFSAAYASFMRYCHKDSIYKIKRIKRQKRSKAAKIAQKNQIQPEGFERFDLLRDEDGYNENELLPQSQDGDSDGTNGAKNFEFLQFDRSIESFITDNTPPKPKQFVRMEYGNGRRVLYCTFKGTACERAMQPSIIIACFAGLWVWLFDVLNEELQESLSLQLNRSSLDTNSSFSNYSVFVNMTNNTNTTSLDSDLASTISLYRLAMAQLQAVSKLSAMIRPYVSYMVVFYAMQSLTLWRSVFVKVHEIQLSITDCGLQFAGFLNSLPSVTRGDKKAMRKLKFDVYRYLNVLHFFSYLFSLETLRDNARGLIPSLQHAGLITKEEKEVLEDCHNPFKEVIMWLNTRAYHESFTKLPLAQRLRLVFYISRIKTECKELGMYLMNFTPTSWAQVGFHLVIFVASWCQSFAIKICNCLKFCKVTLHISNIFCTGHGSSDKCISFCAPSLVCWRNVHKRSGYTGVAFHWYIFRVLIFSRINGTCGCYSRSFR